MTDTRVLELKGAGDRRCVREAAEALREGRLVVFPTETVYGLGCCASVRKAVERLYSVKRRPRSKPFAFYVSAREEVLRFVDALAPLAERAIERFWPGPVTLLLPTGESGGVAGFRCPDDETARALIFEAGIPLVATSANVSGSNPPLSGDEAEEVMRGIADLILKGGAARYGGESTILDLTGSGPRIVREGVISAGEIRHALGLDLKTE